MVFIKELILRKYQQTTIPQTTLSMDAKSVYLKCIFFNFAIRCETAVKTNDPLYKHLQLGVGPNPLKVFSLN